MAEDVQKLLLQVDATTALLRQELARARQDIDKFESGASRRLGGLQNSFDSLGKTAGTALSSIKGLAGGFVGLAAIGQVASLTVNATREMQKLSAQLEVATGSAAAANTAFNGLAKFAAETPFTLTQVTEAYIRLKNLGINPTEERLRAFGNTSAAMGKDLMQFIEAVADASTGEFERLKEFGIRASKEGDKVRFTFQGVTKEVQFNAEAITDYLEELGRSKFGDAMAKQAQTIDGKMSNLQDAVAGLGRALGGLGVSKLTIASIDTLTRALTVAANVADKLRKNLTPLSWSEPLTAARADYQEAVEARMAAERRQREGGVSNRLLGGNTFNVATLRQREASAFAEYTRLWNQQMAQQAPAATTGTSAPSVSATATKAKTKASARTSRENDFIPPEMRQGWAQGMGDNPSLELQNQALRSMADTLRELQGQDFQIELVGREQLQLAEDYTRTLTEGLAQAVIYGRNFGDVLKGIAQQILSSGLINILSGGKFGTSFGDSLGAIGSLFGGFRANGGPVSAGKAYVVGEKRPELFVPSTSGNIIPSVPGGGQGGTTRVVVEPSPLFAVTVIEGATQAARAEVASGIAKATRPRMRAAMGV